MLEWLLALGVFFVVVEPFVVLLHELGHAGVALARGSPVTVELGSRDGAEWRLGGLTLVVSPALLRQPITWAG